MLAVKMGIVLRLLRGMALGLVLTALSQPQAAHARVKQHCTTSAHAVLYPVPSHPRANVRKTARATVAHATGQVRPGNNLHSRPLIVIDPGHGGRDPGAIGTAGTLEKTVTLAAAQELRRQLEATGRYRVALTRTGDRTVSLAQRLAFARSHEADLLIAIHADASRNHRARGASVYVGSGSSQTTALAVPEPQSGPGSTWLQVQHDRTARR